VSKSSSPALASYKNEEGEPSPSYHC
jgi:hypothetical protein